MRLSRDKGMLGLTIAGIPDDYKLVRLPLPRGYQNFAVQLNGALA